VADRRRRRHLVVNLVGSLAASQAVNLVGSPAVSRAASPAGNLAVSRAASPVGNQAAVRRAVAVCQAAVMRVDLTLPAAVPAAPGTARAKLAACRAAEARRDCHRHRAKPVLAAAVLKVTRQEPAPRPVVAAATRVVPTAVAMATVNLPVIAAIPAVFQVAWAAWVRRENALVAVPGAKRRHRNYRVATPRAMTYLQAAVARVAKPVLKADLVALAVLVVLKEPKAQWRVLAARAVSASFLEKVRTNARPDWAKNSTNPLADSMRS
jgi:hypothetical protein